MNFEQIVERIIATKTVNHFTPQFNNDNMLLTNETVSFSQVVVENNLMNTILDELSTLVFDCYGDEHFNSMSIIVNYIDIKLNDIKESMQNFINMMEV